MLTRAYDAIMASLQVPMITNQNVDFNASAIDDSVLNCKDYNGVVRSVLTPTHHNGSDFFDININANLYPFVYWRISTYNVLLPDEDASDPNYEDYSVSNDTPSGWIVSSSAPLFEKTYDMDTKEFVCRVKILWQNTSGSAKTVYGVKVRCNGFYRNGYNSTSRSGTNFLLCREHFSAPVVVEDQGIISLTFTWRVGRAGLVSATTAAAK